MCTCANEEFCFKMKSPSNRHVICSYIIGGAAWFSKMSRSRMIDEKGELICEI